MPQLIPFYWLGQLLFAIAALTVVVYVFGKFFLPTYQSLHVTRNYISKL